MSTGRKNLPPTPNTQSWVIMILLTIILGTLYLSRTSSTIPISEHRFETMLLRGEVQEVVLIVNRNIVEVKVKPEVLAKEPYKSEREQQGYPMTMGKQTPVYTFRTPSVRVFNDNFKALEAQIAPEKKIGYTTQEPYDIASLINWGFGAFLLVGFWFLMRRMVGGGPGGQIFNIGQSRAALFDAEKSVKVTFADIAGLHEAKEEVMEIVEFLKNPERFTKLGGKIPKGALLIGPPGTGKTLLAKAVAGEAGVPFFSLSGSDFVEMFVGVGAARVRDLFNRAKGKAPCIIFIDEIDAVGRSRGRGQMPGANDERENTLNSLLVEMDGFATDSGVIILAATNRPDVLDQALLRPGRFDRQISLDKPDIVDREAILKVHIKALQLAPDVDAAKLAAQTPGFAGAELANICNEAALIAARRYKQSVDMADFQDAIDRVIGGLEKKNKIISPQEKEIVAYHEAGHAVTGWFLEHTHPLVKVSIVPRGVAALGYAQYLPKEQFLYQTEQLLDELCMLLGGRAAEELAFGKISTGALSDLEQASKMAYSMVSIYGMNKKIGHISFHNPQQSEYNFTKPYSESTAKTIDEEVRDIIEKAYNHAKKLLQTKNRELETVAQALLTKEVIFQQGLEQMIGKRPYSSKEGKEVSPSEANRTEVIDATAPE